MHVWCWRTVIKVFGRLVGLKDNFLLFCSIRVGESVCIPIEFSLKHVLLINLCDALTDSRESASSFPLFLKRDL